MLSYDAHFRSVENGDELSEVEGDEEKFLQKQLFSIILFLTPLLFQLLKDWLLVLLSVLVATLETEDNCELSNTSPPALCIYDN